MNASAERHGTLVKFLLGALPEEEHAGLEERLFTDGQLQEEIDATRDDLIHGYLAGALSAEERSRFETYFLAFRNHQERLEFIRDLLAAVGRERATRTGRRKPVPLTTSRVAWAVAAGLLLASAAIVGLTRTSRPGANRASLSPQPSVAPVAPVGLTDSARPSPAPPRSSSPPVRNGRVHVVALPASPDAGAIEVALIGGTRTIRLEARVPPGPPSYDAILRKPDGSEAWRAEGLIPSASGEPLILDVPAAVFEGAEYVLSIQGERLRRARPPAGPLLEHRLHIVRRER